MPPLQYERIRDSYLKRGKSEKEAKSIAAATYNARHPGHPMNAKTHGHFGSGGNVKKRKGPSLPPQLAGPAAGMAPPGGAPMGPGNVPPPGMKKGGSMKKFAAGGETVKGEQGHLKHWKLHGEDKDAHGKKVGMKHGGKLHSRGGGAAKKGYASGGHVSRGDGIAERGHTRGTCR